MVIGGWIKIKKLTKSALLKNKKRKKKFLNKPTIFTAKNFNAVMALKNKSVNVKHLSKRRKLISMVYDRMLLHLKPKFSKKLIYKTTFRRNIAKKVKRTLFKMYKKERLPLTKDSEINHTLSIIKQFKKYNVKKNVIKTLINSNKTLNIGALNFFNKYLNSGLRKLKKNNKKLVSLGVKTTKLVPNTFKTLKTTILLKFFFQNPEIRHLLLRMNKNGTKIYTFTKVLKLLLNPISLNFLTNKSFMVANDSNLNDYFTDKMTNKQSLKLSNIRPVGLGYV